MPSKPQSPLLSDVESLKTLPIDQLEQEVLQSAAKVSAHVGGAENFADSMGLEPGPAESPLGRPDGEVRACSEILVAAGLLRAPTDTVTPDLRRALQAVADQRSPGLYDVMTDDRDLQEVLQGVVSGSWGIGGGSPSSVDASGEPELDF